MQYPFWHNSSFLKILKHLNDLDETGDAGEPPYPFTVFSSWGEAIGHLRLLFVESGLPENHWSHEGREEELRLLIDKETHIKILLYGSPLHFACETLGVKDMINHKYSKVFTVSKEEVYEYTSSMVSPRVIRRADILWMKA